MGKRGSKMEKHTEQNEKRRSAQFLKGIVFSNNVPRGKVAFFLPPGRNLRARSRVLRSVSIRDILVVECLHEIFNVTKRCTGMIAHENSIEYSQWTQKLSMMESNEFADGLVVGSTARHREIRGEVEESRIKDGRIKFPNRP